MLPHKLTFCLVFLILCNQEPASAQNRKPPAGGRLAIVVDERLAALRTKPQLNGKLVRRLGRGRMVAIRSVMTTDDITFFLVNVSTRTQGWIQREAVVSPSRQGDDQRLMRLIEVSQGYDQISRARIFLDHFPRSPLRPKVLLLLGDSAERIADKLSSDAARKINQGFGDAPEFSYYLNYSGLDRYNRQRVAFVFDQTTKRFHYDGAAWRELIRRYPKTPEAADAKKRLRVLYSHLRRM
jgi:hypothetical protein